MSGGANSGADPGHPGPAVKIESLLSPSHASELFSESQSRIQNQSQNESKRVGVTLNPGLNPSLNPSLNPGLTPGLTPALTPAVPGGKRPAEKKEMPLSCQRCRLRKVKCNFAHPCSSCVKLGVECIAVPNDMRKKRPPANYVSTLEKQIDSYEKFVAQMHKLDTPAARSEYFDAHFRALAYVQDRPQPDQGHDEDEKNDIKRNFKRKKDENCQKSADISSESARAEPAKPAHSPQRSNSSSNPPQNNSRPVYGPTSVYENDGEFRSRDTSASILQKRETRELHTLRTLAKDPDVRHCLRLFFTWQYPNHNMFVFREAFFVDFFNAKPNSLYCSSVLVLSLCALGARMSDVGSIYSRSLTYYNEAKSQLLSSLEQPSIPSVQSFLLLAFYDICNGHNSTGWMLSGNAMRMGFDLGFQLNPQVWFLKHRGPLKQLDVSIRSRIYWGCFMADHFISLVLGRPSLLKLSDASIPETEDLPELDWIDEYKYIPETATNISDPLKEIIHLISISDNMLNDIFTRSESLGEDSHQGNNSNSGADDYNLVSRLSKLFDYNAQIQQWKAHLPSDLRWDRESLNASGDNPTLSVVRYYYYILILCLNRPFVGLTRECAEKAHLSPAVVCTDAIEDLYVAIQRFETAHGLRRASIFIVYCSILSISVILFTATTSVLAPEKKTRLRYFLRVLAGCSKTWRLAEKSHKMIAIKLRLQFADDPDFRDSRSVPSDAARKLKVRRPRKAGKPLDPGNSDAKCENLFRSENLEKSENISNLDGGAFVGAESTSNSASNVPSNSVSVAAENTGKHPAVPYNSTEHDKNGPAAEFYDDQDQNAADGDYMQAYNGDGIGIEGMGLEEEFCIASTDLEQASSLDQATTEFFGGPPVLMTSDLFNEDWEALFPDSIFSHK